ncbi:hypothetical protein [Noviherbaspirillum galbum]|uniref:Uncharacterized protein n=1 Tax=Noviherbaspirillum galbum TaxID=2709383 RepID=A0A6B3SLF4_9BURK|nr:hypothetical protein [Noviherbaspirillum galbum]NEX60205.1 hypothetical protein [Noviherbaspirillum galbum]
MPRDIPKQKRFRPFQLQRKYEEAPAKALTMTPAEVRDLVDAELAFLADVHAAVSYSMFERIKRQQFCERIMQKMDLRMPVSMLTNREAGFLIDLEKNK